MSVSLYMEGEEAQILRRLLLGADATTITRDGSETPARILQKLDAAIGKGEKLEADRWKRATAFADELLPCFERAMVEGKYVRSAYSLPEGREWTGYVYVGLAIGDGPRDWVGALKILKSRGFAFQMVVKNRRDGVSVEGYRFKPEDQRGSIDVAVLYEETGRCTACGLARSDAHVRGCTMGSVHHRFPAAETAA